MPDTPIDLPVGAVAPVTLPAPVPTVYAAGATNGVAMTPPPTELMASMHAAIASALTTLPPEKSGGIIALYSRNADGTSNANMVAVQRVASGPLDFNVLGWFGKTWKPNADGSTNFGAAIQLAWK
jgi:hypothetical protein